MRKASTFWVLFLFAKVVFPDSLGTAVLSPPGKMVDVGGHALHLNCSGKGRPTVVLEGGAGEGFSFNWASVQQKLSKSVRVCSYDRAGYAWSDPGPQPRTLKQIAYELHTALRAADERGPFILVGHSLGTLIVRTFAQLYPAESAGFVLIDATHEDSPLLLNNRLAHMRQLSRGRIVPEVQEKIQDQRAAQPMRPAPEARLDSPFDRLPLRAQEFRRAALQNDFRGTSSSEFDFLPEEMNDLWVRRQKDPVPLGDKPLIVISAATRTGPAPPGVTADDWRRLNEEKAEQQTDMARLSRNSKVVAAKSEVHEVHVYEPDLVVSTIREIVVAVRSRRPLG